MSDYGWKVEDSQTLPLMTDLPAAPSTLLQVLHCNCASDCRTHSWRHQWWGWYCRWWIKVLRKKLASEGIKTCHEGQEVRISSAIDIPTVAYYPVEKWHECVPSQFQTAVLWIVFFTFFILDQQYKPQKTWYRVYKMLIMPKCPGLNMTSVENKKWKTFHFYVFSLQIWLTVVGPLQVIFLWQNNSNTSVRDRIMYKKTTKHIFHQDQKNNCSVSSEITQLLAPASLPC